MSYSFPILEPSLLYALEHMSNISKTAQTLSLPSAFCHLLANGTWLSIQGCGFTVRSGGLPLSPMPCHLETGQASQAPRGCFHTASPASFLQTLSLHSWHQLCGQHPSLSTPLADPPPLHDSIEGAFYFLMLCHLGTLLTLDGWSLSGIANS